VKTGLVSVLNTFNTLYLEGNPAAGESDYRLKVVSMLPNLFQLDANEVREDERAKALQLATDGSSSIAPASEDQNVADVDS